MKCPSCGADASGRFCASCGTPLDDTACSGCGAALAPGDRFCSQCGAATGRRRAATGAASSMPWMIGMLAFAVVAVVLVVRFTGPDPNAAPGMQGAAPGFGADAPAGLDAPAGPMGGTMRENADRLFNRVMSEREAGASDRVEFFVPMAIQAYQASGELDADGLYHLALLQNVAGQPAAALETASRILETSPGHLLALATAAEAAALAGDSAAAAGYYRTFLESYELERALSLPEYLDHARVIQEYRTAAESFLAR